MICSFSDPQVQIIYSDHSVNVVRSGDDILVDGATCQGATVTNTGLIDFYDNASGDQKARISLAGGPFAPGLDAGASAEIDFSYTSSILRCDRLVIVGSLESDHIVWGGGANATANLNADETEGIDADLTVLGCVWGGASGEGGSDVLSAAGEAGTGNPAGYLVFLWGGPGDDVLLGGDGPDRIRGGDGADHVTGGGHPDPMLDGGGGPDAIRGGPGRDRILGGGGPDAIRGGARSDGIAGQGRGDLLVGGDGNDVLDGGSGFDTCRGGPGKDKFISCEKIVD
jgi:Ca2+-binding RTX toxin-like protein